MSNYCRTLSVFSLKKKEEKLYLFEKEEKCEQELMLLKLSDLLFPIIGFV